MLTTTTGYNSYKLGCVSKDVSKAGLFATDASKLSSCDHESEYIALFLSGQCVRLVLKTRYISLNVHNVCIQSLLILSIFNALNKETLK